MKLVDNNVLSAYEKGDLIYPVSYGTSKFSLFSEDVLYAPENKEEFVIIANDDATRCRNSIQGG